MTTVRRLAEELGTDPGDVRVILAERGSVVWFGAVSDRAVREVRTVLDDAGQRTRVR
jgi:butyrate kinase